MLWAFFLVLAILGVITFLYAFRALRPANRIEQRMAELEDRIDKM